MRTGASSGGGQFDEFGGSDFGGGQSSNGGFGGGGYAGGQLSNGGVNGGFGL